MAETNQKKSYCRGCGSEDIRPVVYGLPTAETFLRAALGEVLLGGCVVFGNEPDWRCATCGAAFDNTEFAADWMKESLAEDKATREAENLKKENPGGSKSTGSRDSDT